VFGVVLSLVVFAGPALSQEISAGGFLRSVTGEGAGTRVLIGLSAVEADGRPAACFGLTKLPGEPPRYTYLLILRAPAEKPKKGASKSAAVSRKPPRTL
jgi:hypothetical protein